MTDKNKMRFYYTEGASHVTIELPNTTKNDRGPMSVEVSGSVEAVVDMEVEYIEGKTHYPFGEDIPLTETEPDKVVGYELTIKLRGAKVAYWWGEDPRSV